MRDKQNSQKRRKRVSVRAEIRILRNEGKPYVNKKTCCD